MCARACDVQAGIETDRENIDLASFIKNPMCVVGGLNRAHVLALRLFTSRMGHAVNMPLHDGCAPLDGRRHPYPSLVIHLNDAVWKLRLAQVENRKAARKLIVTKQEALKKAQDEQDDDAIELITPQLKEAVAALHALEHYTFWRGVSDLSQTEFKQRGCTEIGFMSMSKERKPAQEHAEQMHKSDEPDESAEDEMVYLPLSTDWKEGTGGGKAGAAEAVAAVEGADEGKKKKQEVPILMFKVLCDDENTPADLAFLSVYPQETECVHGLGAFLEMGKVYVEYTRIDGEDIQYKTSEVSTLPGRNLTGKAKVAAA